MNVPVNTEIIQVDPVGPLREISSSLIIVGTKVEVEIKRKRYLDCINVQDS